MEEKNQNEEEFGLSPVQKKINMASILVVLLKNGKMSNSQISKKTGLQKSNISTLTKEMEDYRYITIGKGIGFDQRKIIIELTGLGKAQALLAKWSSVLVPGRDKSAEEIVKLLEKVKKKK